MENKPNIGIVPLWDKYNNNVWTQHGYSDCIIKAGGLPVILPLTEDDRVFHQSIGMCDGFLLTGGQDVSPAICSGKIRDRGISTCPLHEKLEIMVIDRAIERNLPLLGIRSGLQFLNAALGGTLRQDPPSKTDSGIHDAEHEVIIEPDTPLAYLMNSHTLTVSNCPHQEITKLSPILKSMARTADGAVEAVYMPLKKFIWAVQWHPELSGQTDKDNVNIFKTFITYAKLCRSHL